MDENRTDPAMPDFDQMLARARAMHDARKREKLEALIYAMRAPRITMDEAIAMLNKFMEEC